ncbi:MAG: signal peptidase II [Candidatus Magasanikbacteria bacterium]|nr:signal peptidase II [Candidatus Magasanikbacteria bacterium]
MANNTRLALVIVGGFLFIADRIFKTLSASAWSHDAYVNRFLGWSPSTNTGIAFGLPVPQIAIIILSIAFITILLTYFFHAKNTILRFGFLFILLGAISNLFDRLVFHKTLDYFLFVTSLFNLADILIIIGAVICIFNSAGDRTAK